MTLVGLYIDGLETCLDEINEDSLYVFKTLIAILLYVDDVVQLSKFRAGPRRFSNKLYKYCTYSSFDINLLQT